MVCGKGGLMVVSIVLELEMDPRVSVSEALVDLLGAS